MRRIICATATVFGFMASSALAQQDPIGVWQVTDGFAHIRVDKCGDQYWGVVAWEQRPGGIDTNNPDAAKRTRPTLGMPVLLAMKSPSSRNRWNGEIYNSENGKTYTGNISLSSPDVLRVEGCLLGFLCGGQDWTRVAPAETASAPGRSAAGAAGRANASPRAVPGRGTASGAFAPLTATTQEFCANVIKRAGS